MEPFSKDFIRFFKELKKNNNTAWFNENRKLYEKAVKEPFKKLVDEVIGRIHAMDPEVGISASDAIFRINRDIRFAKDKSPYNTHVSANISRYGRNGKDYPGFYFQLGADKMYIGGGAYMLEKEGLYNLREQIAKNAARFEKVIGSSEFVKKYGGIQGEKNKIVQPEFKEALARQPLIANKQFYYMAELGTEKITSPDLAEMLMEYYRAGKPVNDFLKAAWN
jgi:uncharacterized protein (TIGR02453 family)